MPTPENKNVWKLMLWDGPTGHTVFEAEIDRSIPNGTAVRIEHRADGTFTIETYRYDQPKEITP